VDHETRSSLSQSVPVRNLEPYRGAASLVDVF
jgi:hypothetical protein